ncbi:MAG: nucleotidyltransferase family protein [Planctomycetota bacterium]|jgi:predicted nucleotidyltransferase
MLNFEKYNEEIQKICQKYKVKSLTAFGSALSGDFNDNSDIDFLIELFEPYEGISRFMNVKFDLESLFNRSVDLVMPKAIKNSRIKKYIYSNTREVYAA